MFIEFSLKELTLVGLVVLAFHCEFGSFFLAVETPLSCNDCLTVCVVSRY